MINQRVKDLRAEKGLTQEGIAKILGVTQVTYHRYESGERSIPDDIKIKLADFHNVTVDYTMGRTDNRKEYIRYKTLESKSVDIEDASFYEIVDLLAAATNEERKTALGIVKALLKK